MPQRRIIEVKVDDLIPYERNARTHSEKQIAKIAKSIERFGWTNPILIDGKNIVAGHGRLAAAESLGMSKVPCIRLDGMQENDRRAYIIADNQLALEAGWDWRTLSGEFEKLNDDAFDLSLTGFNQEDWASLFAMPGDGREVDANDEWRGMPEYTNEDQQAFQRIILHFRNQADVDAFAKLIEQKISSATKYLWFPLWTRGDEPKKSYEDES